MLLQRREHRSRKTSVFILASMYKCGCCSRFGFAFEGVFRLKQCFCKEENTKAGNGIILAPGASVGAVRGLDLLLKVFSD